nr:glycosyltransferase [uncultured Blautia sp.]
MFQSIINTATIKNALFHFRTFGFRSMLRKTIEYLEFTRNYNNWQKIHVPSKNLLTTQQNHTFLYSPTISIIVPIYRTPEVFLRQLLDSVTQQTYSNWELCIADGSMSSSYTYIQDIIHEYQVNYPNIRYKLLPDNKGISGNTNAALALSSGDYISLLDHDDILAPDALFEVVKAINISSDIDVIYTDEDKVNLDLTAFYDPNFKPDFDLDYLRSCNYITHFYIVKRELALQVGGFDLECNGSQDYDFILKTSEKARKIYHIPRILYHWRIHPASVAGDPESKSYAYTSAIRALQNHLNRCQESGTVYADKQFGYYKIQYKYTATPLVSIILRDCNLNLKSQITNFSTYSNIEFVDSPNDAHGNYIVFLYKVNTLLNNDWIEQFLGNCSRSSVGLIGSKIFYNKSRVLEAGLVFTPDGRLHSPFQKYYDSDPGYNYHAKVQQCCSFISSYCFMIKRDILFESGYSLFEKGSLDSFWQLCMFIRKKQLSIVFTPHVNVICTDKPSRNLPYLEQLKEQQDPYYNPNFSQTRMYHLS